MCGRSFRLNPFQNNGFFRDSGTYQNNGNSASANVSSGL